MSRADPNAAVDRLYTTAELKALRLCPRAGQQPAEIENWTYRSRSGVRYLWRLDQARLIRDAPAPAILEANVDNVLSAMWSVNRSAKRRRDAAERAYSDDLHGFAGWHKRQKVASYNLKDIGLAWLAHRGEITAVYRHGSMTVWAGHGYSFHSTLAPQAADLQTVGDSVVRQEAKPARTTDMRIVDARSLLSRLTDHTSELERTPANWQYRRRRRHYADCDDDDE